MKMRASRLLPALVQDFLNFVIAQPADRPINHGGGFGDCAVGDFNASRGVRRSDTSVQTSLAVPENTHPLFHFLNYCGTVDKEGKRWAGAFAPTYGKLVEVIQDRWPELLTEKAEYAEADL